MPGRDRDFVFPATLAGLKIAIGDALLENDSASEQPHRCENMLAALSKKRLIGRAEKLRADTDGQVLADCATILQKIMGTLADEGYESAAALLTHYVSCSTSRSFSWLASCPYIWESVQAFARCEVPEPEAMLQLLLDYMKGE